MLEHIFSDWFRKKHTHIYIAWLKRNESEYEEHKPDHLNGPEVQDSNLWSDFNLNHLKELLTEKEFTKITQQFSIYLENKDDA